MDDDSKPCPVCGETIKRVALKCRFCNTDLVAFSASKEFEIEKDLYVGRPALIYDVRQFGPIAVAFALLSVAVSFRADLSISVGYAFLVFLAACGVIYLRLYIQSVSKHFEITTQRIKLERGLFSKIMESLELYRIDHFELHKPLGMRLLGYGTLHIFSSDEELQSFYIYGVPNIESLADTLRNCQLRERTRRHLSTFVRA
jgi:uncharacterized membrane protein YdbT with pleckstrin-like domain